MDEEQNTEINGTEAPETPATVEAEVIDLGPTLTELCQDLKNWFVRERYSGTFTISDGNITADFLTEGQYFRIMGSIFSDGVHKYPATDLSSETFTGSVWALAIPKPVLSLAEEIKAWRDKYETTDSAALSPFQSESFGGYSYSKSSGYSSGDGNSGASWQNVFRSRLNMWRKLV